MRRAKRLPLEELAPYLLEVPEAPARLDWHHVFNNDHPVELEVGFGKGLFLLNASQVFLSIETFGVELVDVLRS